LPVCNALPFGCWFCHLQARAEPSDEEFAAIQQRLGLREASQGDWSEGKGEGQGQRMDDLLVLVCGTLRAKVEAMGLAQRLCAYI